MPGAVERRLHLWLAAALVAAAGGHCWQWAPPCLGGEQSPHIGYIYPAGGQQGTTVDVTVGGQYLTGVTGAYVTGQGVQATLVKYIRALSQAALNDLQDKLSEIATFQRRRQAALEEGDTQLAGKLGVLIGRASDEFESLAIKAGLDDPTPRGLAELRNRLSNPKRQLNPQLGEAVAIRVTLSPGAEPGERELRLKTSAGVTNLLFFHVGQCREYRENEPNDHTPDSDVLTETVEGIEFPNLGSLPVILNGQILPGDVDRFRFAVRKGTRMVAAVSARSLIPYLADAVPGWFQATLALFDPKGNEVAFTDDFRFNPDPIIYYEVPESGEYTLEIHDAIYRGREDFVYRITVGELPLVTSIFPLGGQAGASTAVKLDGWNLPGDSLTIDAQKKGPGIVPVSVSRSKRASNCVPFALDSLPECLEAEPNNDPRKAQPVKLPTIVNGRIDQPGDWDVFSFTARAGDEVVAEVHARRLGSPLDSVLKLTDAAGKQLALNDDYEDRGAGFTTHHADSLLQAKLPADGTYFIHLGDTQHKGGTAHGYRLRISAPRPDFELRVAPSCVNARAGAIVPITVHALRKDGFCGEITLSVKDPPQGFSLGGAWIPEGQDSVRLTLATPPAPHNRPIRFRLEGRAVINGTEVCRLAVPAEDMMQAFAYRHLVPSRDGMVTIAGSGGSPAPLKLVADGPVKLPAGGTGRVPFSAPKDSFADQVRLELDEPPKGITVKEHAPEAQGIALVLAIDATEAKPGLKGNLILNAFLEVPVKGPDGKQTGTRRTPLGILPAVPFEIVAPPASTQATQKQASN